jgi:hypothetical protein
MSLLRVFAEERKTAHPVVARATLPRKTARATLEWTVFLTHQEADVLFHHQPSITAIS